MARSSSPPSSPTSTGTTTSRRFCSNNKVNQGLVVFGVGFCLLGATMYFSEQSIFHTELGSVSVKKTSTAAPLDELDDLYNRQVFFKRQAQDYLYYLSPSYYNNTNTNQAKVAQENKGDEREGTNETSNNLRLGLPEKPEIESTAEAASANTNTTTPL